MLVSNTTRKSKENKQCRYEGEMTVAIVCLEDWWLDGMRGLQGWGGVSKINLRKAIIVTRNADWKVMRTARKDVSGVKTGVVFDTYKSR